MNPLNNTQTLSDHYTTQLEEEAETVECGLCGQNYPTEIAYELYYDNYGCISDRDCPDCLDEGVN